MDKNKENDMVEEWLRKNTISCPIGRITKEQCIENRKRPKLEEILQKGYLSRYSERMPFQCDECTEWYKYFTEEELDDQIKDIYKALSKRVKNLIPFAEYKKQILEQFYIINNIDKKQVKLTKQKKKRKAIRRVTTTVADKYQNFLTKDKTISKTINKTNKQEKDNYYEKFLLECKDSKGKIELGDIEKYPRKYLENLLKEKNSIQGGTIDICRKCFDVKVVIARGMCRQCYDKERYKKIKIETQAKKILTERQKEELVEQLNLIKKQADILIQYIEEKFVVKK